MKFFYGSLFFILITLVGFSQKKIQTYCNPLNLNYRFQPESPSRREAADPVIHLFKGQYFLYASKSGGYWCSDNMLNWKFIPITTLPVEDYAPSVVTIRDTVYFIASVGATHNIYSNANPLEDNWKIASKNFPLSVTDPCLFNDDDGKVYLYWGCSNETPIMGTELDPQKGFNPKSTPLAFINHNARAYGWEKPGDQNEKNESGWNEGAWMNKHEGKYYLQYAAPGTQFKGYADGVYVSDFPLGPFVYMPNSPFSYKPGGFITGAGHGATFADKYGNYWHVATMTISIRHMFERRLGLFPTVFDKDGLMHTYTAFGDYPSFMPEGKVDFEKEQLSPVWMLLSYNKSAKASSCLDKYPVKNAFDEDVRTWWSAASGNKGEWLSVDLAHPCVVNAIQVNFADNDATLLRSSTDVFYQYEIYASNDEKNWTLIIDKHQNKIDAVHDYIVLNKPVKTRYLKIVNARVPDGKFSIYDLRVFGNGLGKKASEIKDFKVSRDDSDKRKAFITWTMDKSATGVVVNYGISKDKLYSSVMVYQKDSLTLTGLNADSRYYFSIDVFNENGVTKGKTIKSDE